MDKAFAGWLLGVIPALEQWKGSTFVQLLVQVVLIAILAVPIWLGVRKWLNRQREGGVTEDQE
jgi:hypothetical protein